MTLANHVYEATLFGGSAPIAHFLVPILADWCLRAALLHQSHDRRHLSGLIQPISVPDGAEDRLGRNGPALEEDKAQVQGLDAVPGYHEHYFAVRTKDLGERGKQRWRRLRQTNDVVAAPIPTTAKALDLVMPHGSVASHLLAPSRGLGGRCGADNVQPGVIGPGQLRYPRSDAACRPNNQEPLALAGIRFRRGGRADGKSSLLQRLHRGTTGHPNRCGLVGFNNSIIAISRHGGHDATIAHHVLGVAPILRWVGQEGDSLIQQELRGVVGIVGNALDDAASTESDDEGRAMDRNGGSNWLHVELDKTSKGGHVYPSVMSSH
jgi:hypothetical protein